MITYFSIGYSDIYPGTKPNIKALLDGINSKIVILLMAMVNAELTDEHDVAATQKRLTLFVAEQFPVNDARLVFARVRQFEERVNGPVILWGKRYALELMKREFLDYRETNRITNTPEESVRIFKAYLLIADELNEKDRAELKKVTDGMAKDDPYFFEKLVWPFVLKQFSTNERVNPVSQMFRLFALIKYSIDDPELLASWKAFIEMNGFKSLRTYLGSVSFLIGVAQKRFPEKPYMKIFSWIRVDGDEDVPHLHNLAFDRKIFVSDAKKQDDFLGMREHPLWETDKNEFIALDLDYLVNKVYNGPLFDMYNQVNMGANTRFKSFADFKSHVATEVSEKILFTGVLKQLFSKKGTIVRFDDRANDHYPDCYIRAGKKIFLIEFKDYLFPGKLVDQYSFDEIKKHIDLKFVKNEKGKNKGINQILGQLKILDSGGFDFDPVDSEKINVYAVIVHTNFTYQMPGVNYYLNNELGELIDRANLKCRHVEQLVLMSLDSILEFLQIRNMDLRLMENFIKRYVAILKNRGNRFMQVPTKDNFVRARASFDEIFATIMDRDQKYIPVPDRTDIFLNSIGVDDDTLDAF